jgi:hypothetical protein
VAAVLKMVFKGMVFKRKSCFRAGFFAFKKRRKKSVGTCHGMSATHNVAQRQYAKKKLPGRDHPS